MALPDERMMFPNVFMWDFVKNGVEKLLWKSNVFKDYRLSNDLCTNNFFLVAYFILYNIWINIIGVQKISNTYIY